ncbi:glutamate--tRNA ligase [bacterium]|nr:glutamate--tRNA ligase [bacterium]
MKEVRTRIAPSPTGYFHLGIARTALFNFLFAKKNKGKFILRIDDTDKERSKKEYEIDILKSLLWLGIFWDEGPVLKSTNAQVYDQKYLNFEKDYLGDYGPYRESERTEIYKKYLKELLDKDLAYLCFCKKEDLEAQKQAMIAAGQVPKYPGICRNLSKKEALKRAKKEPFVIRLKVPSKKISFLDLLRGKIEFDLNLIGDFVISKGFEEPLYNFTTVIDDYEMKISHIIRGEDHISNTPKQIILQEVLEFPKPKYLHLPLILGEDKTKLSKRHGAISIKELKELGYLPEAIVNYLALLGWWPKDDIEIFSLKELIELFEINQLQKHPAIFSFKKLDWINKVYIRKLPLEKLTELCQNYFEKEIDFDYLKRVVALFQERLSKISEIKELANYFFEPPQYPKELLLWKGQNFSEVKKVLKEIKEVLSKKEIYEFSKEKILENLKPLAEKYGNGPVFWPLRVALSGKNASPPPQEIAEILGKEETIKRIEEAIKKL